MSEESSTLQLKSAYRIAQDIRILLNLVVYQMYTQFCGFLQNEGKDVAQKLQFLGCSSWWYVLLVVVLCALFSVCWNLEMPVGKCNKEGYFWHNYCCDCIQSKYRYHGQETSQPSRGGKILHWQECWPSWFWKSLHQQKYWFVLSNLVLFWCCCLLNEMIQ